VFFWLNTGGQGWKNSPDSNGYAVLKKGFCSKATAFEWIAGTLFIRTFTFASNKVAYC